MSTVQKVNKRALVSIFMLVGFAAILVTGLLSYGLRYSPVLSAIHTVFGLLFVSFGIFHLRNNFTVFTNYLRQKTASRWFKLALAILPITVVGVMLGLPPFKTIVDVGYALKELRPIDRQVTETLTTRYDVEGQPITVEVKAGEHYTGLGPKVLGVQLTTVPQMAIWIESPTGEYLDTLYVTKKGATGTYLTALFADEDEVRRPEALPHWSHQRGVKSEDGLMVPSKANPLADAITGATPLTSYELASTISQKDTTVMVKMEVNRSFDYNHTYSESAFPNDPIYSGSGNSAQPSLIYGAEVDLSSTDRFTILKLLGRGHHSGQHGEIIDDLAGVTTALALVDRVIVDTQP